MKLAPDFAPRRVVVLRPRGLGDIVLSSAVIEALTRAYPRAEIDYVAEAPARALLETDGRLAELFLLGRPIDVSRSLPRVRGGGTPAVLGWLRARRPELVVDLFSNPYTALLSCLSGAPWRVGFDRRIRRLAYNVRVPRFHGGAPGDSRWAGEVQLDVLRDAGVRWAGEAKPGVALTDDDRRFAGQSLEGLGYPAEARFGAVLPGGSWETKRWSTAGYVAAGRELARRTGLPSLVHWGPPERPEAEAISASLQDSGRLAPPTTLRQMAALVQRAEWLVAPDCLGRHLAIVLGTPSLGVFGSTDPKDWTPPSGLHRVVRAAPGTALRDLPPAVVLAELGRLFERGLLDTSSDRT